MSTVTTLSVSELNQEIASVVTRADEGYIAAIVTYADGGEKVIVYPPESYFTSEGLEIHIDSEYITLRFASDEYGFSGRLERGHGAFSIASFAALILDGEEQDALMNLPLMEQVRRYLKNLFKVPAVAGK